MYAVQYGEEEQGSGGEGVAGASSAVDAGSGLVTGSQLGRLEALREALAWKIVNADARELPALAKQFRETLSEIAVLEKDAPKGSVVDDLARRRSSRRAGTEGSSEAAGDRG